MYSIFNNRILIFFRSSFLIILLVFSFPLLSQAREGDLDPTFDGDGKVITDFGTGEVAFAVNIQADGKIVAAGHDYGDCMLARYNPDGSLDSSFDGDGKVITDFGGSDYCYAMGIQPDGKIVIAGTNWSDFILARYNSDGSLDTSFDSDGKVTTDFGGTQDIGKSMAIQPDGKIAVAGYVTDHGNYFKFAIARYNPDGSLDTSFYGDGTVVTVFGGNDYANAIAIQSDNKIVVAGDAGGQVGVARYNLNGSLDGSFSGDGRVTLTFANDLNSCTAIAIQSDGKIVIAGYTSVNVDDFAIARLNPDGTLDNSFDNDGKVTTDFSGSADEATAVSIQTDGKILAAGTALVNYNDEFALARYNIDGSLDNNFGVNGKVTTDFAGSLDFAMATAIQADGKIVLAGDFRYGNDDFAVARYEALPCIFCDDFEDGLLDSNWTYNKAIWNEIGGNLVGTPTNRIALAIADPAFAGCQICSVETSMNTAGGTFNRIKILGWNVDKKNRMELLVNEESDRIVLKQIVGGSVVSKNKAQIPIDPNIFYSIRVSFDGTEFNVLVNNSALFSLIPATAVPIGTIGFLVKNTTGQFGYIAVH